MCVMLAATIAATAAAQPLHGTRNNVVGAFQRNPLLCRCEVST
jgi:hypothetical protein